MYSAELRIEPREFDNAYIEPSILVFNVTIIDPYPPTNASTVFVDFQCFDPGLRSYTVGQDPLVYS